MPDQEVNTSIDTLIGNWNTGFSVLSKRRSSGMPVSASDVHKNVIDAGTNIFRCGLNPSVVA